MTLELDLSDDFALITDWLKPVVIDSVNVNACLRRAVGVREAAASGGKYTTSDTAFHLDSAECSAPAIGGTITDEDGDWTIISVDWQTFVKRWRCVSRQLAITGGLTVTIQQATYSKGATGAEEPTWANMSTGVSAKVHYESAEVETTHGNRVSMSTAKVYFASPQTLGAGYRILASDGATLKVMSWDGFDEIEQFFTATCEVSKWPQS
jgi:hypothetical protein